MQSAVLFIDECPNEWRQAMSRIGTRYIAGASLLTLLVMFALARFGTSAPAAKALGNTATPLQETAIDAYIYGYPLVTMEMTRRVITNVEVPKGTHAPMGQLIRMREYPSAAFQDVTAP